jgi:hypothetical protein
MTMSVDRLGLFVCSLCMGAPTLAADEPSPDAELLEYLGMWEQTDEEWVLQDGLLTEEEEERSDPAKEEEESPENEDES